MSSATFVKMIRRVYPDCRIRIEVTTAGIQSHCITIKLLNAYSNPIRTFTYYGHGNVETLKAKALQKLAEAIATA